MTELGALRARIEAVDDALVDLLAARAAAVAEIWALKRVAGVPRVDPDREAEEIERMLSRAEQAGLDRDAVREILARVVGRDLH